jgi:hypothetical protein
MLTRTALHVKNLIIGILITASWLPAEGRAQGNEDAQYKERISQAVREFELGNWQESRALFKQAHQLKPNARTLRGMGMAAFEMRKYLWARRDLDASLRDNRQPLNEEQSRAAKKLIEQTNAFIGRFRLTVEPPTSTVEADEKPAEIESDGSLLLEIGEHPITARAPDYQDFKQTVTVEGGEDRELKIVLESVPVAPIPAAVVPPPVAATPAPEAAAKPVEQKPAAPPKAEQQQSIAEESGPTWAWASLGISALTGIGAGGFWMLGTKSFNDLKSECEGYQCNAESAQKSKEEIEQLDKLATIFVGVSVSFAALSIVLFIVESIGSGKDDPTASKASAATTSFGLTPSGWQLQGRF